MKIQTNLVRISPYFMFLQQVKDNMNFIRGQSTGVDLMPLQFGGYTGQLATIEDNTVLEITEFQGDDPVRRIIAPTLR